LRRFQASFWWFFFFLLFHASMMSDLIVDAHDVVEFESRPTSATLLGVEVLEEKSYSTRFLFLSRLGSSECAGGGDVVELVPSSESSASSPSWLSTALGASDAAETGSA
jgi:hypothetical protein